MSSYMTRQKHLSPDQCELAHLELYKMIIRNQPIGFYCRFDAQNPMCRRRKLS